MKDLDWDRIQEIYHEALTLPSSDRHAFIARAANGDPALIREVNELVGVGVSLGDFLKTPIVELPLTHAPENLIGTTIDNRYLIERELGRGGMGQLYLAHHLHVPGRYVVIKFLLRELMENESARRSFEQESTALSRIRHRSVVEVLDTGELADGRPYFVMEYVDGETLDRQIPKEGMPLQHAASILRQIGAALEHVHTKGVFHRDLKPENIMLRRGTDSVVLIDFGIAKVANPPGLEDDDTDVPAGTLMYMSPEQLQDKEITAASDIYSLAVTAYEMLTGRRPFNATSREQLLDQQRKGVEVKPVVLRRDLSLKAQSIILRGLSFKPTARDSNVKQFGDELAQALIEARPNRKTWIRVPMIVLGVALLSFGVYKYWTWRVVPPPNRSFDYYLTVQPTRDGHAYRAPYKSHGEEIFANGDNFRLTVTTPVDAFVYVFHDGSLKENGTSFKMLFPRKTTNGGSASLGAGKSIESDWMTFEGPPGVENFWLVWSTAPVKELENVKQEAFEGLTGDTLARVKQYLTTKNADIKATTSNYKDKQTAVVRARHDPLVALAQFKHR